MKPRFASSLRTAIRKISAKLSRVVWTELTATVLGGLGTDLVRSRRQLLAENALLRQQLIVASRSVKRPSLRRRERGLLALLVSTLPQWRDALLII